MEAAAVVVAIIGVADELSQLTAVVDAADINAGVQATSVELAVVGTNTGIPRVMGVDGCSNDDGLAVIGIVDGLELVVLG